MEGSEGCRWDWDGERRVRELDGCGVGVVGIVEVVVLIRNQGKRNSKSRLLNHFANFGKQGCAGVGLGL